MGQLQPFFPKSHGRPRVDDRRVSGGIVFVNHNDLRWCDALKAYGPPKTLDDRWKRQSIAGTAHWFERACDERRLCPDDAWPGFGGRGSEDGNG